MRSISIHYIIWRLLSNTLIPADLCFTDTLEDIPRIRNINKIG